MRVLYCGSRTWTDEGIIEAVIVGHAQQSYWAQEPHVAIVGGARGADKIAERKAQNESGAFGSMILVFNADWEKDGRAAGVLRNQRMLDEGKPDLVVAFVDKPLLESRGTLDMVTRAENAGVPTYVIEKSAA